MATENKLLPTLEFTKNWENDNDFHTIETEEKQVRADMQLLHDEAKNYLNDKLTPAIEAELATKATKEEVNSALLGQVPDDSLEKAKLAPELRDELDAKAQQTDVFKKSDTLTDATAGLFGLETPAVPNDVFGFLGKYNQHWWSVQTGTAGFGYSEVRTIQTTSQGTSTAMVAGSSSAQVISYSSKISIDQSTGAVSLVNPKTLLIQGAKTVAAVKSYIDPIIAAAPVYITNLYAKPNVVYYVPRGVTWTNSFYNQSTETFGASLYDGGYAPQLNTMPSCANPVYVVSAQIYNIPAGSISYVRSSARDAYPDNETVGDLTYRYLGVPFEKTPTAIRLVTGSYVGTGKYGAANRNAIRFDFIPRVVVVYRTRGLGNDRFVYTGQRNTKSQVSTNYTWLEFSVEDTTFFWCEEGTWSGAAGMPSATGQLNISGETYRYFALG